MRCCHWYFCIHPRLMFWTRFSVQSNVSFSDYCIFIYMLFIILGIVYNRIYFDMTIVSVNNTSAAICMKIYESRARSSVGCASAWHADGRGFDPRVRQHSFMEIGHEIGLRPFSPYR